jgi:hypothetical protein
MEALHLPSIQTYFNSTTVLIYFTIVNVLESRYTIR